MTYLECYNDKEVSNLLEIYQILKESSFRESIKNYLDQEQIYLPKESINYKYVQDTILKHHGLTGLYEVTDIIFFKCTSDINSIHVDFETNFLAKATKPQLTYILPLNICYREQTDTKGVCTALFDVYWLGKLKYFKLGVSNCENQELVNELIEPYIRFTGDLSKRELLTRYFGNVDSSDYQDLGLSALAWWKVGRPIIWQSRRLHVGNQWSKFLVDSKTYLFTRLKPKYNLKLDLSLIKSIKNISEIELKLASEEG